MAGRDAGLRIGDRWHLFCAIVDNLGDIGVCWRLARQLVAEHGVAVTLWVDQWADAAPMLDVAATPQRCERAGVRLAPWSSCTPGDLADAAVVIEAFGCALPDPARVGLAAARPRPALLDLEYLTAERWADGYHGLSSTDAETGARRFFFFPGPGEATGGLIREAGLLERRDLWRVQAPARARREVVVFAYPDAPLDALLDALAATGWGPTRLRACGTHTQNAIATLAPRAQQTIERTPFLSQPDFDALLWGCDLAFVRGEDSLVRALWSGRPFVWQPYPQAERTHEVKLAAWLDAYACRFPTPLREALRDVHAAWCGALEAPPFERAFAVLAAQWPAWCAAAEARARAMAASSDLAPRLFTFVQGARVK